jgi:SAM-dependent methyltransferase
MTNANAVVFGGIGSRLKNPLDWFWDLRFGIKTFGYHPAEGHESGARWYLHFVPSVYDDLFRAFRAVGLNRDDVFVDVGSGLGRAVFAAAHAGVQKATGIEYVAGLHAAAERNRHTCRLDRSCIAFHCGDALDIDISAATVLFLFHPFGANTMAPFLEKLRHDRQAAKVTHAVRIIYYNPVFPDVFAASGWLNEQQRLPEIKWRWGQSARYPISIWTS